MTVFDVGVIEKEVKQWNQFVHFYDKFWQYSENMLTQGIFLNCKANNADESVNSLILQRCQKVFLSGRNSVEIAAANTFLFGLMMFYHWHFWYDLQYVTATTALPAQIKTHKSQKKYGDKSTDG